MAAAYNHRDARAVAELYHEYATNFQAALSTPSVGKQAVLKDSLSFFVAFPDNCTHVENLLEDGEWAILKCNGGGTWRGEFAGTAPNSRLFAKPTIDLTGSLFVRPRFWRALYARRIARRRGRLFE